MPINTSDARSNQDPVFLHARREAIIIFLVWVVALLWAVPYCYATGYNIDANQLQLIYGIPGWVFGGIVTPWLLANIFTIVFCLRYITDDDLGEGE